MNWQTIPPAQIAALLRAGQRVHCVGAGGVSMSPLCEVLQKRGLEVSGSDRSDGEALARLRDKGLSVFGYEDPSHLKGVDVVVRTAAAGEDNPIIAAARAANIPVLERADAWGHIMRDCKTALCVTGTHGKTTTTGMLAHIALAANADPTIMLGGRLPVLDGGYRIGESGLMIAEADEYCNSFHRFAPTTALLLNIEADHHDFFSGLDEIIASFRTFCQKLPPDGHIIANIQDENVKKAVEGLQGITWFGQGGTVCAKEVTEVRGRYRFVLEIEGEECVSIAMGAAGLHNLQNALGAAAAAWRNGLSPEAIARGLESFGGTGRRMEYIGEFQGAALYDDYAHHPTEVAVTLRTASSMSGGRVIAVFQPHTYTRTKALLQDMADALCLCDTVFITDIYAARETDPGDIHAKDLCAKVRGSVYCETPDDVRQALRRTLQKGDMAVIMGAGDINQIGKTLVNGDSR